MNKNIFIAAVVAVSGLAVACGSTSDSPAPSSAGRCEHIARRRHGRTLRCRPPDACGVVVKDADCDKTLRPFVFVHGTYGSGDNFAHVAALLTSNGYCPDHIVAAEYNSLGDQPGADCTAPNTPQGCGKIDAVVDAVLAKFPTVHPGRPSRVTRRKQRRTAARTSGPVAWAPTRTRSPTTSTSRASPDVGNVADAEPLVASRSRGLAPPRARAPPSAWKTKARRRTPALRRWVLAEAGAADDTDVGDAPWRRTPRVHRNGRRRVAEAGAAARGSPPAT